MCDVEDLSPHTSGDGITVYAIVVLTKPLKITNMNQTMKMTFLKQMKSRRGTNTLILFRNGDNFEAYHKDAKIIAKTLTLNTFIEDGQETVRFPASYIEVYSNRLLDAGHPMCISEMRDMSGDYKPNISMEDE